MNRILAFMIKDNSHKVDNTNLIAKICDRFNFSSVRLNTNYFQIDLIYEGDLNKSIIKNADSITFCLGQFNHKWKSTKIIQDRFLSIEVSGQNIVCQNDYVGSIPIYYSKRDGLILSNLEPLVIQNTHTKHEDLSYSSIFGFMRYSHLIWDETPYKHIFMQEPDSKYIYDLNNEHINKQYLKSIKLDRIRKNKSDREIARELYELNQYLVEVSLSPYEEIILPLSSGYDSRMILAACSQNKELLKKIKCFTYGPKYSIEVVAAKELCETYGVFWKNIDLPCNFLEDKYLEPILNIFGSSLHPHGMYQLEFWDQIKPYIETDSPVITSGFMTGVPAGQHVSKLDIKENTTLRKAMDKFSQSNFWDTEELINNFSIFDEDMLKDVENKFSIPYNRIEGDVIQKSIVFDVWTRQRNFISYYPRTLEWKVPVISPHMTVEYQNFFLSLNDKHLTDRYAVELMFQYYYPETANTISNSNGLRCPIRNVKDIYYFLAQVMNKLKLRKIVPDKYKCEPLLFNIPAFLYSMKKGLYPIFDLEDNSKLEMLYGDDAINQLYEKALNGNLLAYQKLLTIQAIAYGLKLIENK